MEKPWKATLVWTKISNHIAQINCLSSFGQPPESHWLRYGRSQSNKLWVWSHDAIGTWYIFPSWSHVRSWLRGGWKIQYIFFCLVPMILASVDYHIFWLVVWTPLKKYESQLGSLFPIHGKIKNDPNHQPVLHCLYFLGSLGSPYLPWDTQGYQPHSQIG